MYKPSELIKILTFLHNYNSHFVKQNVKPDMDQNRYKDMLRSSRSKNFPETFFFTFTREKLELDEGHSKEELLKFQHININFFQAFSYNFS